MPAIDLSILNQRQTPAFYADVLANRPPAGFIGRIFVSTNTFEFYRDNGTGWDIIGGPGAGTVTGGGSLYRVAIWNSTSSIGESNNLIFDFSTNRLGIGTNAPGTALDVHSTQSTILQLNQTSINDTRIAFQLSGAALWRIGNFYNGGANDFELFDVIGAQAAITVKKTSGQVLIGTSTVGSGKLVVASATGDNGVQIVGASAPSLRIDNAASGPTKRAGLGISTAVNNFIQGSADRDFCIFNGSTAAASPILFGVYDGGTVNVQEAARISAVRNLLVGTTVDSTFRLDVSGTIRGTSSTEIGGLTVSHTNGNTFQTVIGNGSALAINQYAFRFAGNQLLRFIPAQDRVFIEKNNLASGTNAQTLNINGGFSAANLGTSILLSSNAFSGGQFTGTSGTQQIVSIGNGTNDTWIPSSGNATYNVLNIQPVINTSGTYAGIVRGLYYNPGLTSLTGVTHRAIETVAGDVIIGSTSGSLLVGTTTNAGFKFDCNGTARVQGQQTILVANAALGFLLTQGSGTAEIRAYPSSTNTRFELQSQSINASIGVNTTNSSFELYNNTVGSSTRIGTTIGLNGGDCQYYAGQNAAAPGHRFFYNTFERVRIGNNNTIFSDIGFTSISTALLQIDSTTRGFLPPRMTTAEKNAISSPATGLVVFDTTLGKLCVFSTTWQTITSV